MDVPAVSVIIPMYNAEKYIGDCLDSILAQTFQDFEVIVVDDCSTDNSVAIVKSYLEKFGGRLWINRTIKNSGGGALPRNKGVNLSRGEYLLIIDNDDAITPTALEELYTVAKKFDADVVACERYYKVPEQFWNDAEFRKNLQPISRPAIEFVDEPSLLTDDILERLNLCNVKYFLWPTWAKLIRRDFIFENELCFADTITDDMIFTICSLCTAEKFVLVPSVVNYYRMRAGSISHDEKLNEKFFRKYVRAFATGFRYFDKFLNEREMFRGNSQVKYTILEILWNELLWAHLSHVYEQVEPYKLDKALMEELSADDNLALAAFTFNKAADYWLQLNKAHKHIASIKDVLERLKNGG